MFEGEGRPLLLALITIFVMSLVLGCGTDPDDDGALPSDVFPPEDSVQDVPSDGGDDDTSSEDSDSDIEETDGLEDTDDTEEASDAEEEDIEETTDADEDVTDTDVESDTSESCTTVCDCSDQVADYCRRPPGVCFPVTIPEEREYCCTSSNCPTGESCENPDGTSGVCD
jgi:hypothetical protein